MSDIVATVYCEQKLVFDRRHGKARPVDVQRKAAGGTFEHFRFELEGYTRNPIRLLAKIAKTKSDRGRPAADTRCFIATQVYGPEAYETNFLRAWRDRVLMPSRAGRLAVRLYYATSPALVPLMRRLPQIEIAARALLDRFIRALGGGA